MTADLTEETRSPTFRAAALRDTPVRGVLSFHLTDTADEAFDLLRLASQALHRKVRDIAADVTETGALSLEP